MRCLRGLSAVGELTPRINDMVVISGERLSSRMVAEAFSCRELDAVHVDARTVHRDRCAAWQGDSARMP